MKLQRAARKYVDIPVRTFDRNRRELPLAAIEVATLAPGTQLAAGTAWTPVQVQNKRATIYMYGPDAGGPAAGVTVPTIYVPPEGLDLYIRPSDAMESDPVYVDRISLA
jgi:hypothetical protein